MLLNVNLNIHPPFSNCRPPGECYTAFKNQFMLFTFCLTLVMGLQFRYQRAKLYRQVAMGEKHHMTVSQGN